MKKIIRPRQMGKTTELIKIAAEKGLFIVCPTKQRVMNIYDMATKMGLTIPFPISASELPLHGFIDKTVLVDDADEVLRILVGRDIEALSMTSDNQKCLDCGNENCRIEYDNNKNQYYTVCDNCGKEYWISNI